MKKMECEENGIQLQMAYAQIQYLRQHHSCAHGDCWSLLTSQEDRTRQTDTEHCPWRRRLKPKVPVWVASSSRDLPPPDSRYRAHSRSTQPRSRSILLLKPTDRKRHLENENVQGLKVSGDFINLLCVIVLDFINNTTQLIVSVL